jgi:hypothetical protein
MGSRRRMRDSKGAAPNSRAEGGCNCAAAKDTLKRSHHGISLVFRRCRHRWNGVIEVTSVGAYAAEVYWVLCANFRFGNPACSTSVSLSHTRSRGRSGMQIFQPQNLCSVTEGYEERNSAGWVGVPMAVRQSRLQVVPSGVFEMLANATAIRAWPCGGFLSSLIIGAMVVAIDVLSEKRGRSVRWGRGSDQRPLSVRMG